jgi:glycosyltransferase involved in cell wall biosynthesis
VAEVAAPTKFAEYSSMGIPVLTTNVGDAASLVRMYKSGIVVDDNSPENLIHGIRKFLNLYHHNKNAIKQMGRNSRRLAEKEFNWEVIGMNLSRSIISLR